MSTVDRINELRARRVAPAAEVAAIDAEVTQLIRQALDEEGMSPTKLAKDIGVSRGRIYQIKENKS